MDTNLLVLSLSVAFLTVSASCLTMAAVTFVGWLNRRLTANRGWLSQWRGSRSRTSSRPRMTGGWRRSQPRLRLTLRYESSSSTGTPRGTDSTDATSNLPRPSTTYLSPSKQMECLLSEAEQEYLLSQTVSLLSGGGRVKMTTEAIAALRSHLLNRFTFPTENEKPSETS